MEIVDLSLVNWSRAQFALTAMYHWLFVPLTLGITVMIAIMESFYVKTGNEEWKKITKFWMKLFGINFAVGIASGLILEFEFGTNWSNYSWFVGDIFGAPLAVEGILAFFMEATFIAIMFFGWNKVGKKTHLTATWLTAVGANLSALWILVANAWMQYPTGVKFNPETARNEMTSFWEVLFSPMAVDKFLHTVSSGFLLASVFVIGISCWFLLKKRETALAKKSILIAAVFGLFSSCYVIWTGHNSASTVAKVQPMKLAAFEGLNDGGEGVGLIAIGVISPTKKNEKNPNLKEVGFSIKMPKFLSFMATGKFNGYVPGINELLEGDSRHGVMSIREKMRRGRIAVDKLKEFKEAQKSGNTMLVQSLKAEITNDIFQQNYFKYFGYGHVDDPNKLVPNVPLTFYSFHIMVLLGFFFVLFFIVSLVFLMKNKIQQYKWFLWTAIFSIPLVYLTSQAGWITAELGRQPWVIQDLMPTWSAVTRISSGAVQVTFWLFAVLFAILLIAELKIMFRQIKIGPKKQ